ncbi:MAG TPA: tryptophan synthase subunit alpha, partial [Chitinophagaceae bacterium]|nr:tryptophan synthase subunit alpha [Chitinophagaceae bacterium]
MSRIKEIFKKKSSKVLNVYCTSGYPHLHSTIEVMKALQESGADIIELGIPYSDPLADGLVIQMSNSVALKNGMTISKLFDQLKGFRNNPPLGGLGVLLMGYMNPVLQYDFEKFCSDAARVGI